MNSKLKILISLGLISLVLTACGKRQKQDEPLPPAGSTFTITWVNYDGTVLEIDTDVEVGTTPTYDGETPTREYDGTYIYTWSGWSPAVGVVRRDQTYTATYSKEQTYTITWKNYDGTVLETDTDVRKGTTPTYDGETPTRPNDDTYKYTWNGWSPAVAAVTKNQTYTATYSREELPLEFTIDFDLSGGTSESYNGPKTVTELSVDDFFLDVVKANHNFRGWSYNGVKIFDRKGNQLSTPEIANHMTFVAEFSDAAWDLAHAVDPIVDGNTIKYGLYPQKYVSDASIVTGLNNLSTTDSDDWVLYNGEYYAKKVAQPKPTYPNNSNYKFDDGVAIVEGNTYWFKCEPIVWNILKNNLGEYFLLSSSLLENYGYSSSNSKYITSEVRGWLNDEFYNAAFAFDGSYVLTTEVGNSPASMGAESSNYASENTFDKVYMPCYQDYINTDYGFSTSLGMSDPAKKAATTDWAKANGAFSSSVSAAFNNGIYWTRSPYNGDGYSILQFGAGGTGFGSNPYDFSVCPRMSINVVID